MLRISKPLTPINLPNADPYSEAYFMSDSKIARIQDRMNKGLEVKGNAFSN